MSIRNFLINKLFTFVILFSFYSCNDASYLYPICNDEMLVNENISDISELEVFCRVPIDTNYWQGITTDGKSIYVSNHSSGKTPNLILARFYFDGRMINKRTYSKTHLFDDLSEWNISDWMYNENDGKLYTIFGRTSNPHSTRIVSIDPKTLELEKIVYQSNSDDSNTFFYGEGIDFYNHKWWISYEGYSAGNIDYIDEFNQDWKLVHRYKVNNLDDYISEIGYNRIQGINFKNDFIWLTIHPQKPGWTYRGSLIKAKIVDENIFIIKSIDLSSYCDDCIGEGIQWYNQYLLLNGLNNQVMILKPKIE